MCYHTSSPLEDDLMAYIGNGITVAKYPELKITNGFDHPDLPAMISSDLSSVCPVYWGFTPPSLKSSYTTLNAKAETLFTSPLYAESARNRRCIVLVKGFYEWRWLTKSGSRKEPFFIERNDQQIFTFGGIWKEWQEPGNAHFKTLSIITTEANKLLTEVRPHNPRMPLILDRTVWDEWLNSTNEQDIAQLMVPYQDGPLRAKLLDKSPLSR